MDSIEKLHFLTSHQAKHITKTYGTPVFVYSQKYLTAQARTVINFPAPYGVTVRYAMKANPNRHILQLFDSLGVSIDASSGFEAERAMRAGIEPYKILLTAQELPANLEKLVKQGMQFDACSLHQLHEYGKLFPATEVGIRVNPGLGSGHSFKTNVGGPSSSFGIWHEYTEEIKKVAKKYELKITRLHTHIGSGTDHEIWKRVARLSLEQVKEFEHVKTLNLGGGFKVSRMSDGANTDIAAVGTAVANALAVFKAETGRELQLEIEPGSLLVANAGSLLATVQDITETGDDGYEFLKINSGMTEILRPSFYGAQHPIVVVNSRPSKHRYVVVGHCCESSDLLTPQPAEPGTLASRLLNEARIGDLVAIEGAGAYCSSMNAQNYNSFPRAAEVLLKEGGKVVQISRRQTIKEMLSLES